MPTCTGPSSHGRNRSDRCPAVLRAVVAAKQQHGDAGNHDADGRHDSANNAPVAERDEVWEGLAAERAEHLIVMHRGRIVESGPSRDILRDPF